tara:strand:- start:21989 stop:23065 length:1077 start_codon:yes stop_codon:yes gene_type:complete
MNNENTIKIHNKSIGDKFPTYITFEAGPTHNGFDSAKELINVAKDSGADAIKFQILNPERLIANKDQIFEYEYLVNKLSNETQKKKETLYDILKRRSLTNNEWIELKNYSDSIGIAFFATVAFEDEIKLVEKMGCHSIKIASADVNYNYLINLAAKTGLCIQLDTGNATISEIEEAVSEVIKTGNNNIIIHHCPSGYPARFESINLNVIKTLKKMFTFPIAFSDHSPGYDMDLVAISFGAKMLEKTITMNREYPSIEHIMSLEPDEAYDFVKRIRNVEIAFGSNRRLLSEVEIEKRNYIRRSPYLLENTSKNTKLAKLKVDFCRPGLGLTPNEFYRLQNAKLNKDLQKGCLIKIEDLF